MDKNKFERLSDFKKVLVTIASIVHIAVWSICKYASYLAAFVAIGIIYAAPLYLILKLSGVDTGINATISSIVAVVIAFVAETTVDDFMTDEEKKKYFG